MHGASQTISFQDQNTLECLHADSLLLDDRTSLIDDGHGHDGETTVAAATVTAIVVENVNVVCGGLRVETPKVVIESRGGELGSDELGVTREVLRQKISEGAEVWSDLLR